MHTQLLLEGGYPWARFSTDEAEGTCCYCAWCEKAAVHREGLRCLVGLKKGLHIAPGQKLEGLPKNWYSGLVNHQRSSLHVTAMRLLREGRIHGGTRADPSSLLDNLQEVRCSQALQTWGVACAAYPDDITSGMHTVRLV